MRIPGRRNARLEQAPEERRGRRGRQLDKEATKKARTRHALGVKALWELFGVDRESAKDLQAERRRSQGKRRSHTKPNWTRPEKRATARAASAARRGRTLQGRTNAKRRKARTPKGGVRR